jgi:hypothetical protein
VVLSETVFAAAATTVVLGSGSKVISAVKVGSCEGHPPPEPPPPVEEVEL